MMMAITEEKKTGYASSQEETSFYGDMMKVPG